MCILNHSSENGKQVFFESRCMSYYLYLISTTSLYPRPPYLAKMKGRRVDKVGEGRHEYLESLDS